MSIIRPVRHLFLVAALAATCTSLGQVSGVVAGDAQAASLPGSLSIASGPQGSINYTISAGLATIITKHTSMRTTVVPHGGTSPLPMALVRGDPPLGVTTGTPPTFKIHLNERQFTMLKDKLRIVNAGTRNTITFAVHADSDIRTIADIKGKRVTAEYSALPPCRIHTEALLANIGLTLKDMRPVPVTGIIQAVRALGERRVDVLTCGSPAIRALRQVHARTPIRFVSIDPSPEAMARALAIYTYSKSAVGLKKGAYGWLPADGWFLTHPWFFYGSKDLSNDVVYAVVKAIWENYGELKKIHGILRGWAPRVLVQKDAITPYHAGAIRFFKEVGAWGPDMDALQKKLLAQ